MWSDRQVCGAAAERSPADEQNVGQPRPSWDKHWQTDRGRQTHNNKGGRRGAQEMQGEIDDAPQILTRATLFFKVSIYALPRQMNTVVEGVAAQSLFFVSAWEFWISSIFSRQWSETKPAVQKNSFLRGLIDSTLQHKWTDVALQSVCCISCSKQQSSLISNSLLTHVLWV